MADIKDDVRKMQAKGNYGDGSLPRPYDYLLMCRLLVRRAEIEG